MPEDEELPIEEVISLGKEVASRLSGKHQRAIDRLVRIAERGRRPSSTNMAAVKATEHFRNATDIMKDGKG